MAAAVMSIAQLASRARRRVQAAPQPDRDVARQRRVVDAFLAADQAKLRHLTIQP